MLIEVKTSLEMQLDEWVTYTDSFNKVFLKTFTIDDFKHKYLNTIDDYSYHVLLKSDNRVVGGFTVIPYEYIVGDKIIRVGFPLDVFILSDFRKDFLSFYKMYKEVKKTLILNDISLVIITPNNDSYNYWKKVIKMKDVGLLKYYALPIRINKIITYLPDYFNYFSMWGASFLMFLAQLMNFKEKVAPIRINRLNDVVEKQRYTTLHNLITLKNTFFSYRIINEAGIVTCYLIDFYNIDTKRKDTSSLRTALRYIRSHESVDLILFIGKLSFFQNLLFKVPHKKEPKHLYFMADIINKEIIDNTEFIYDFKNWDFGLFNYDVR